MKKIHLLKQLLIIIFLSSAVCFAQKGVVSFKQNKLKKNVETSTFKMNNGPEVSPNTSGSNTTVATPKAMWDVVFNYPVGGVQEAGIETDGNFIYTSDWAAAMFYKYDMTGILLDSFSIATVTGVRDLAFDGTYFYGGANVATIYKMDFTNHTLIGTIACPAGTTVRNIAYDPTLGGFWVGGWDTDIICVDASGTVLSTITAASHGLSTIYGSAYDSWSPGGPYLWLFDQGTNSGAIFNQIDLATLLPTGITHDCAADVSATSLAGGAFCYRNNGQVLLGGVAQGEFIFAYELVKQAAHCDLSPTQLIAPLNSDSLTVSDSIKVNVANYDTITHYNIPISYVIDGGTAHNDIIDSIEGGSFVDFTFQQPYDFSIAGHVYDIEIYTSYGCDTVNTNDTLSTTIFNYYDASSVSIDLNAILGPGNVNPMATVENAGSLSITFDATLKIGTYTSTKTVASLAPGATQQITFDPWTAVIGSYTSQVYTQLANDMDHTNDTITKAITIQNLTKVYCFVAYDPTSTLPVGPAYTYLEDPGTIVSIADQSSENFVGSGTWGLGNKWYGTVSTDNTLITMDTVTGARTIIGSLGIDMSGITYDYTTHKLFGVSSDGTNSSLYSISQTTGAANIIGTSTTDALINLACDTLGNLYSVGITNDLLYSINKSTGLATSIGAIGFDAAYAQDMEFEYSTNLCYMADYNNTTSAGDLSLVNLVTGAATAIGTFAGGSEITGFAIPHNSTAPALDASVSGYTSPESACGLTNETITISIDNLGSSSISGFPVSYVINNGTPVTETFSGIITAGASQNYSFTQQANLSAPGSYSIKAYPTLASDAFTGNDTLVFSVQNISTSAPTYSMGFEPTESFIGWVIEDANADGYTWQVLSTGGNTAPYSAQYSYNSASAANDWLITKCISLQAGKTYHVGYYYKVQSATYPEAFTVNIGTAPNSAAQTTSLASHSNLTNTAYTQGGADFTVASAGTYYLGFQCNSAADEYILFLDDINITDVTGINESTDNFNFTVYPNPAKEMISIAATGKIKSVKMLNVFGQVVFAALVDNTSTTINTSNFADGVYFIQAETENGLITKNITIRK